MRGDMFTFSLIEPLDVIGMRVMGNSKLKFLHQSLGGYIGITPSINSNRENFPPYGASYVENGFPLLITFLCS